MCCNNKDKIFNIITRLETIATWHEVDHLKTDLTIVISFIKGLKCISIFKIIKLKNLVKKIEDIYNKQPNNPDICKINPLIDKILKMFQK